MMCEMCFPLGTSIQPFSSFSPSLPHKKSPMGTSGLDTRQHRQMDRKHIKSTNHVSKQYKSFTTRQRWFVRRRIHHHNHRKRSPQLTSLLNRECFVDIETGDDVGSSVCYGRKALDLFKCHLQQTTLFQLAGVGRLRNYGYVHIPSIPAWHSS